MTTPKKATHRTPVETRATYAQAAAAVAEHHANRVALAQADLDHRIIDGDPTPLQQQWRDAMARTTGQPTERIDALANHAPDREGHCLSPRCRRELWPCPPAASLIRELP